MASNRELTFGATACIGGVVLVLGHLLGLGHGLARRDVDGALAPEVPLALESGCRQRVGIFAVKFLYDVDGPCFIDEARF